eukprot:Polyplicarium_translucidae@DN1838_c0_g1_i3.p1
MATTSKDGSRRVNYPTEEVAAEGVPEIPLVLSVEMPDSARRRRSSLPATDPSSKEKSSTPRMLRMAGTTGRVRQSIRMTRRKASRGVRDCAGKIRGFLWFVISSLFLAADFFLKYILHWWQRLPDRREVEHRQIVMSQFVEKLEEMLPRTYKGTVESYLDEIFRHDHLQQNPLATLNIKFAEATKDASDAISDTIAMAAAQLPSSMREPRTADEEETAEAKRGLSAPLLHDRAN